jgi:pyridoxamine 5'-phosphate oxidase
VPYPDATTLSTVDAEGWPEGRIVLVKGVDVRGFLFFTNYRSQKGRSLEATGRGALTFYWGDLLRQVRAKGGIVRLSSEESDEYFRSRPRRSQIGAWASAQSEVLESRELIEARAAELELRYAGAEVPRPPHWGGYLLTPHEIEFWQEGENRLHDRFRYRRIDGSWKVDRLNP